VKAPVLAIALGRPRGDAENASEDHADSEESDERESFDAFRAAMKSGDDDTAYEALRSMIETCAAKIKEGSYGSEEG
jgi:hypothetical protein